MRLILSLLAQATPGGRTPTSLGSTSYVPRWTPRWIEPASGS